MKKLIFTLGCTSMLCSLPSCKSQYFQIYEVAGLDVIKESNNLVFEDDNCRILYNFWSLGGDAGFIFENKTDQDIILDLNQSFYINNGYSNDYFLERSFTTSKSNSESVNSSTKLSIMGVISPLFNLGINETPTELSNTYAEGLSISRGSSETILEKAELTIPAKSKRVISEYAINKRVLRFCDYKLYPGAKDIKEKKFTSSDSPINFKNIISYRLNDKIFQISNEFFVSGITNIPERKEIKTMKANCYNDYKDIEIMKDYSPNRFFLNYLMENTTESRD